MKRIALVVFALSAVGASVLGQTDGMDGYFGKLNRHDSSSDKFDGGMRATAVQGDRLYFFDATYHVQVGERFEVQKLMVSLRDTGGRPLEWKAVKVGEVVIVERKGKDDIVGRYSGQPLNTAQLKGDGYRAIFDVKPDEGPKPKQAEEPQTRDNGVYRAGGGVSAPTPIHKVDPEYSEEARKAKVEGTVFVSCLVDAEGTVRDCRIPYRHLGMGLDEKAIESVQKWRFKPGMKYGKAVNVQVQIEVNFRLIP